MGTNPNKITSHTKEDVFSKLTFRSSDVKNGYPTWFNTGYSVEYCSNGQEWCLFHKAQSPSALAKNGTKTGNRFAFVEYVVNRRRRLIERTPFARTCNDIIASCPEALVLP